MTSVDIELALTGLVAMLEPATLISSALALALGRRPLRTGFWFYVGGLGATLAVGVLAAFVLGDAAAPSASASGPRTWVSVLTMVAGVTLVMYVVHTARRPVDEEKMASNLARMNKLTTASPLAIMGAGAALANAGPFILIALKDISQLDPTRLQFILDWLLFALASMLPLGIGLGLLRVAPGWTTPRLASARGWIERHARTIALVVISLLAGSLLRDGIAGLT